MQLDYERAKRYLSCLWVSSILDNVQTSGNSQVIGFCVAAAACVLAKFKLALSFHIQFRTFIMDLFNFLLEWNCPLSRFPSLTLPIHSLFRRRLPLDIIPLSLSLCLCLCICYVVLFISIFGWRWIVLHTNWIGFRNAGQTFQIANSEMIGWNVIGVLLSLCGWVRFSENFIANIWLICIFFFNMHRHIVLCSFGQNNLNIQSIVISTFSILLDNILKRFYPKVLLLLLFFLFHQFTPFLIHTRT